MLLFAATAFAEPGGPLPAVDPLHAAPPIAVPRVTARLRAADLGLVINSADPDSIAVGDYYAHARGLAPEQVLRVDIPIKPVLERAEFERLRLAVASHFGPRIQALALAWTVPYAVQCNSITGALALGFDPELCKNSCGASRASPYFNSASSRPFSDFGIRPAMLLAAGGVASTRALIDRGVAADGRLSDRARAPVEALFLITADAARGVRRVLYPAPALLKASGVDIRVAPESDLYSARRVMLVQTGSVRVAFEPAPDWVPGALADHLTSFGGDLLGAHGQTTVLDWIASGATASHGTVSEPCNHLEKFPHPQVLLSNYLQGSTAIEAYWKSVAWPQQSLFVGEPLAAPFARAVPPRPAMAQPPGPR